MSLDASEPIDLLLCVLCRHKLAGLSAQFAATECDELQAARPPPGINPRRVVNVSNDGDTLLRQRSGHAVMYRTP